ncbi:hypothetical protein SAMN04488058_101392 [Deinococcus reticulitermitis]|uniref:Uncharacterized protein n=1 Tax=Deinococcus reticulitermitis TaxID=856736 RepID=A0A1H6SUE3_9DEIO|nr:hypothetical protein [Deinococcus reticulitermitis]SEI70496.1 hypothetical protein SAMN04488058_101392 [Deinococcus reticulitermitis]
MESALDLLLGRVGLPGVTALYALVLALLGAFWLARVAREARRGRRPGVAWWGVPGLLALLLARSEDLPPLFGIGASALLLAEFWPSAYRSARRRPDRVWPLVAWATALGLILLTPEGLNRTGIYTALLLGLLGAAGLLSALLFPVQQRPRREVPEPGFALRWRPATVPEWPEFSVTLTARGAELRNESSQPLSLIGWSPRSVNAWLTPRDAQGRPLNVLHAGHSVFLPLGSHEPGLRVWYTTPGAAREPRLFRADWTPAPAHRERVLH